MNDCETGEEALGNGLLHDLEGCADQRLAGNNGRKRGEQPQWVERAVGQGGPEACGVVLRVLDQVGCLLHSKKSVSGAKKVIHDRRAKLHGIMCRNALPHGGMEVTGFVLAMHKNRSFL